MLKAIMVTTGLAASLAPCSAQAHPGHVLGGGFGLGHYLVDPAHGGLVPVAVVVGAGLLVWLLGNRRPRLRPARAPKPKSKDRKPSNER